MKALVWRGDRRLAVEDVAEPAPAAGEVVLDVSLAGVCGSDLHGYRGRPDPRVPPLVLGHEAVGEVAGRGGRFAVFPLVTCGRCAACARGEEELCERRGLLGLDRPGVFAERVAVREDALVPVPAGLDDALACLIEPLATCVAVLDREGVRAGSEVLVLGCGPLGLLAVYGAARRGARVSAVEVLPERRAVAELLGADPVLADPAQAPAAAADVAIDAAGVEATWRAGVAGVRSGGSVVIIGLGQADGMMPVGDLVRRGIRMRGHYAYSRAAFAAALELLAASPPPEGWLHTMALDEGGEAFRRLVDEPGRHAKILLRV